MQDHFPALVRTFTLDEIRMGMHQLHRDHPFFNHSLFNLFFYYSGENKHVIQHDYQYIIYVKKVQTLLINEFLYIQKDMKLTDLSSVV